MKNLKVMAIALMCVGIFASCEKKDEEKVNVATFENISLGADSINSYSTDGVQNWSSGDFGFSTGVAYEGTYYFNYLYQKFENLDIAICAYNAGETTVRNWLCDEQYSKDGFSLDFIPYLETQNYLQKVKTNYFIYKKFIYLYNFIIRLSKNEYLERNRSKK